MMVCVAWGGSNYRRGGQGWALVIAGLISYGFISNLFFTHGVALAARLWYFPMIAAGLGAGFAFSRIPNRRGAALILVALTLVLASSSWKFSRAWRTERSLAEATLRVFPRCWRANYNLSRECYLEKDFKQGADAAKLAAELRPDDPMSWDYLGLNAMFMDGREGEAEEAFKKEIALDPKTAHAYKNLSNLMKKSGRADEAAAYLQDYLRLKSP
ncbi:tetratricopeptide repeat protein [Candidatus Sumerlaeota bacterium]|nr:tetratricopeptide repeat protein [Candidatus Sumerlaeota bacterium]